MDNYYDKKIAHGIAGWNIVEYLSNAIDSVICYRMVGEPLFVVITGGKPDDLNLIIEKYQHTPEVFFQELKHDPEYGKTGSLYHAYNQLFAQVRNKGFRYLNLIQSDLQLLWWDQDILAHYLLIFEYFKNSVDVFTGFSKRGTNPGAHKTEVMGSKILPGGDEIHFQSGLGDWGFFDLDRWYENDLFWSGTESSMRSLAHKKGVVNPLPRIPCVVDIPWPAVVRSGREVGIPIKRTEMLLVKGAQEDTLEKLKASKRGFLWAEDWVKSWGWWALEPTWNTEFTFVYPIRILKSILIYRNFKYAWTSYGERDRLLPPFRKAFRPQGSDLIHMIKGVIYIALHRISPKLLQYLRKLIRGL